MMANRSRIVELIEDSEAQEHAGDLSGGLSMALQAVVLAQNENDSAVLPAALARAARMRFRLGQYPQARSLAQTALDLSQRLENALSTAIDAYLTLGMCAAETNSLDEAEIHYRQAVDLSKESGNIRLQMRALHNLGSSVYLVRGQFGLALAADEESLRLAKQYETGYYFPLITIPWAYQITGEPEKARPYIEELGEFNCPPNASYAYYLCLRGNQALLENQIEQAREWYIQAYSQAQALGEPAIDIVIRLGLSRCYQMLGDYPNARNWADDALKLASRIGYLHLVGRSYEESARSAWLAGDLDGANNLFMEAVHTYQMLAASFDESRTSLLWAASLVERSNCQAEELWKKAAQTIVAEGFLCLLTQERASVLKLISAFSRRAHPRDDPWTAEIREQLLQTALLPLRIITFGGLEVWVGGHQVPAACLRQRRSGELLALLIISPGHALTDEQIFEALEPSREKFSKMHCVHQATSALRRVLEPDLPSRRFPSRYIEYMESRVYLNLSPDSYVDYQEFLKLYKLGNWEKAVEMVSGEFLPEFRYAEWAVELRQRLTEAYQYALLECAKRRLTNEDFPAALDLARQVLVLDAWQEIAAGVAMQASLKLGDVATARRLYCRIEKTLRDELGVEPQPELQDLYRSIGRKKQPRG